MQTKELTTEVMQQVVMRLANREHVENIAKELNISKENLSRRVKRLTGVARITELRKPACPSDNTQFAEALSLLYEDKSLQEIADHCGGVSRQAVSMWFKKAGINVSDVKAKVGERRSAKAERLLKHSQDIDKVHAMTGLSRTAVKHLASALNIRKPRKACAKKYEDLYSRATEDIRNEVPCCDVARKYNIPYQTVINWAKRLGVERSRAGCRKY